MAYSHSLFYLFLLPLTLFSNPLDFKACQLKYQVSSMNVGQAYAFAVNDKYALFYSKEEPAQKVVKRDPFLGLNLIEADKRFRHSFKFHHRLSDKLSGILPHSITEGRMLSSQIGLNTPAKFSKPLKNSTLITDSACGIVGVSTPDGVIEKEYIKHFLKSKEIVYADVGIRLIDKNGVCVTARNPFFYNMPFMQHDIIVQMDGEKVASASEVSRRILLSKPKSMHTFIVLRDNKKIKIKVEAQERLSGGLSEDNFLDTMGFVMDEHLVVMQDNVQYGVKKGDKLRLVRGDGVRTSADVRHVLSQEKSDKDKSIALLFQRDGFDFFIHLLKP